MGCSNSQLRPIFRRCRRRRSKKEEVMTPKIDLIERNGSTQDLLQGVQLLGASLKHANNTNAVTVPLLQLKPTLAAVAVSATDTVTQMDSSAFSVPLLAQSEASSSQLDFFRMLDQKIEDGPDYDSEDDPCPLHRPSLPTSALLRLDSTGSGALRSLPVHRASPLKFTNWNWDEEGD